MHVVRYMVSICRFAYLSSLRTYTPILKMGMYVLSHDISEILKESQNISHPLFPSQSVHPITVKCARYNVKVRTIYRKNTHFCAMYNVKLRTI